MKKIKSEVWSNLFFFVPAFTGLFDSDYIHVFLIVLVFISSTLFHYYDKGKFHEIDVISALALIIYNLYKLLISSVNIYSWIIIFIPVCFGLFYLLVMKKDDYEWHISSAIITFLVIIVT